MKKRLKQGAIFIGLFIASVGLSIFFLILLNVSELRHGATGPSASSVSEHLTRDADGAYRLDEEYGKYFAQTGDFAFVLDENGSIVWEQNKPEEIKEHFSAAEIASFSKWFLNDYPVTCRVLERDLLVVGQRRSDLLKYPITLTIREMRRFLIGIPLLALLIMLIFSIAFYRLKKREQGQQDRARTDWINGISHDIRTPLSSIMGYAEQWEADESLSAKRREQASRVVGASDKIRTLVSDLNLTMRLDCDLQPLRKERFELYAMIRETAAELINCGLADEEELELPEIKEALWIFADRSLVKRALTNLLLNAKRHGSGGVIRTDVSAGKRYLHILVRNIAMSLDKNALKNLNRNDTPDFPSDGAPAHGTGLQLVRQIAAAHRGTLFFTLEQDESDMVLCADFKIFKFSY